MNDFDAIVVGGGIAGAVAAYRLAAAGHSVALLERGAAPGEKSLSGGVFYCRIMDEIFPGFAHEAPVERRITRHVLSFLNAGSHVNLDYWDAALADPVNAVSVLRARLDSWLVARCEDAGVAVLAGVRVDGLLAEGGRMVGVRAGDDELRASAVIAADGVNSFLATDAGIRPRPLPRQLAVGVKSVIALDPGVLADRFRLGQDDGVAYAAVGDATRGVAGGGFLYTNAASVSVGVVLRLDALARSGLAASELHDHFLAHPAIAPLLAGGELLEYGSHLTIEDGPALARQPSARPGLLIVGDAGGYTLNTGLTIRGMDFAAATGLAAAAVVDQALTSGDAAGVGPDAYAAELARTFVAADLATYARTPGFLANPRLYGPYGRALAEVFRGVYDVDARPRRPLRTILTDARRGSGLGLRTLLADAYAAVRAL